MTGIALLVVVGLWLWACVAVARALLRRLKPWPWRWLVVPVAFVALLVAPVADEIVARHQIEALCREGAVLKVDEHKIKGRRVKSTADPLNAEVPGVAIPVTYTKSVYRDEETNEELASRGNYVVNGGVLMRTLGFTESPKPLLARSHCAPSEGIYEAAKRVGFTINSQLR